MVCQRSLIIGTSKYVMVDSVSIFAKISRHLLNFTDYNFGCLLHSQSARQLSYFVLKRKKDGIVAELS